MLQAIRTFFFERDVLEVETPLLSQASGTDPQLDFFSTVYRLPPIKQPLFLQTSPEFAMKRLLASGSGAIFQICKAFRNGEVGRFHNPEFTMLEWYRPGFDLADLMDEITALFALLFTEHALQATQRVSYQAVFKHYTGLDPLVFSYADYCAYALANALPEAISLCGNDQALWLDFIFSHQVQPHLGRQALCLVYNFPACQSSLARTHSKDSRVVERVELFLEGVELGNGYYELTDVTEQEWRFNKEAHQRQQRSLPASVKDERLLAALSAGLPDCSGVAIGIDRLLMLVSGRSSIRDVLAFPVDRA